MAIQCSSQNLVDNVLEITAVKTKLLLTENDVLKLSIKHESLQDFAEYIGQKRWLRIYPDELDQHVLDLRHALGNIPTPRSGKSLFVSETKRMFQEGIDLEGAQNVVHQLLHTGRINDIEAILELSIDQKIPVEHVLRLIKAYATLSDRDTFAGIGRVGHDNRDWDGVRPLSDLFQTEIVLKKGMHYFDQEFVNYLVANEQDLHRMHWRNFERLVSEFFVKVGYEVVLGPGTNDGGIDIRIWNKSQKEVGAPLIIVQCKRYAEGNLVDINTVKAFYADVLHEDARVGFIATTSAVAPGGHEVISARGYNIAIAESKEIAEMVKTMWRSPTWS